jgi:hypothetical protein
MKMNLFLYTTMEPPMVGWNGAVNPASIEDPDYTQMPGDSSPNFNTTAFQPE